MNLKSNDDFIENADVIDLYFKELRYLSEVEGDLLTVRRREETWF